MSTATNKEIGLKIKELRFRNQLTQKDLALKLRELGYSTGYVTISNYENGKLSVPSELLVAMSKVFDCTVADITGHIVPEPYVLINTLRCAADLIEEQQKEISRLKGTSC